MSSSTSLKDPHVGILAMEVYIPSTYVSQTELELHMGVSAGKYTLGLGQEGLAVMCGDVEDVNSMCLTVVHSLLEKYQIDPMQVGRVEVGTETLVDKSKSTKTVLMDLFAPNTDIEGATIVNACYGGTAALLNALLWSQAEALAAADNEIPSTATCLPRYAIVVAADLAVYAPGPARPTGGAGAVAVLIGRDAPLAAAFPLERTTHASHVWDFYKPNPHQEYPVVDGQHSQMCYYRALEDVYSRFCDKMEQQQHLQQLSFQVFHAQSPDYWVFHAPYNKLVQKSYARLFLVDAIRRRRQLPTAKLNEDATEEKKGNGITNVESNAAKTTSTVFLQEELQDQLLSSWLENDSTSADALEATYADKKLEEVLKQISKAAFGKRLSDANAASRLVGNTYTASVFLGLASLIDRQHEQLTEGKTVAVFSYGSGALATLYKLHVRQPISQTKFTIGNIANAMQLSIRLKQKRIKVPAVELDWALETRARMHRRDQAAYTPLYPITTLFPGTYYLTDIDDMWRRSYARKEKQSTELKSSDIISLAPPLVKEWFTPSTAPTTSSEEVIKVASQPKVPIKSASAVACVITGTAAGLPGGEFVFSNQNLERLTRGDQCITPVSDRVKKAMLEKNVVQIEKRKDGTIRRVPVDSEARVIKLAAQLGTLNLTAMYGVPPGLAETMDVAAQVAVAAGLEALKSAGLVSGQSNHPDEWKLPEKYRDSTGVVYASSFPAMDAAVGEVMKFLKSQTVGAADTIRLIEALRSRFARNVPEGRLSDDDEATFARLMALASLESNNAAENSNHETSTCNGHGVKSSQSPQSRQGSYEFDRKFLFRVLVLGNAQLAQLAGCRGPNTQTNAACAGTTQAIAMAQDMLTSGRAERVVVVAGDNASGDTLLPWLGSGFRALGAATTEAAVEDAALPFDKRRSGLLLGAGGIGVVLETEQSSLERRRQNEAELGHATFQVKARLLATQYSNSAFHGAALDRKHIGSELVRFLNDVEATYGITKEDIATEGVYFSHETCTHASSASSCAGNEVAALRSAFGDDLLSKLLILNTKGFTGHPMGVSFEDVAAVEVLLQQRVPPVPNYKEKDDYLGNLNICKEAKPYACRYALRFAAGFGSQVAFALYAAAQP